MDHFRDFETRFERNRRRTGRAMRVIWAIQLLLVALVVVGIIWLVKNPESIGSFFGRIAAAFRGTAHG